MPLKEIKDTFKDTIIEDCDEEKVQKIFFQTGVWMVNRYIRDKMMPWVERYKEFDCDDGRFLNWAVIKSGVKYQDMNPMFNVKNNGLKREWNYKQTFFLHSAGGKKYLANDKIHPPKKFVYLFLL